MNVIFSVITLASLVVLTVTNPATVVPAMSEGVKKAGELSISLFLINSLWLGVFEMIKSGDIGRLLAKLLKKPIRLIFGKTDEKTTKLLAMNLSCNLLGLGSAATPIGIEAQKSLEKTGSVFQQNMLFAIVCSSIQILPVSVIGLKAALGSSTPEDVILPTLLSTAVSSVCAVLLTKILCKR